MARKKKAPAPVPSGPPIGVKELAAQLLLKADQVKAWIRMGAPMASPLRFRSVADVEAWLAAGGLNATYLGQVQRSSRGIAGPWGLFTREGWACAACKVCASGEVRPFETGRRLKLGDHVMARVERVTKTLRQGFVPKVLIRCWCSARTEPLFPRAWIPPEAHPLIPVSPRIEPERLEAAGLVQAEVAT